MTTSIQAIMDQLAEVFAPLDAEVLASTQAWAVERAAAIKEFHASAEAKALDVWKRYERLHNMAGGKTWYGVLSQNGAAGIAAFVAKNHQATIDKRNASISSKLLKAGVTSVESSDFAHSRDGFDGVFVVNTDAGQKRVTVNTIRAGGYNIQCLHLRVLVKVK